MCVCEREREREKQRKRENERDGVGGFRVTERERDGNVHFVLCKLLSFLLFR